MNAQGPALFFWVDGEFLFHGCSVAAGEPYGDFVNYPHSHDRIWQEYYAKRYHVDFDYYPRGRVVYRKSDDTYLIYYDKCIADQIEQIASQYEKCETGFDEHYQCHACNPDYVV